VCNLTSCIKVACDFVSPHCSRKCLELIDANRRFANVRGRKREDVLQLKTMMMCAWEEMDRWQQTDGTAGRKGLVINALISPIARITADAE
jgi:hypothetical protein